MKKILLVLLLFLAGNSLYAQKQNLLSGKYSAEELKKVLIPQAEWVPFPKPDDREQWSKADQAMMKAILAKATTLTLARKFLPCF